MATNVILDRILSEFYQALSVLSQRVSSAPEFAAFMRELGWDFPDLQDSVLDELLTQLSGSDGLLTHIADIEPALLELEGAQTDEERFVAIGILITRVSRVLNDIRSIAAQIQSIPSNAVPNVSLNDLGNELPQQLLDYVIVEYLKTYHGGIYGFLRFICAIAETYVPPSGKRLGYTARVLDADKLGAFLSNPIWLMYRTSASVV